MSDNSYYDKYTRSNRAFGDFKQQSWDENPDEPRGPLDPDLGYPDTGKTLRAGANLVL